MQVRRFDPDFSDLPRWWYQNDPVVTHAVNALNLIFPDGERFFVRSVRHYQSRIQDPELAQRVRDFMGQESQHGHAHAAQIEVLEAQGFEVASWLNWYRKLAFGQIEGWTPYKLRLSITVAMEHLTASFASFALEKRFLRDAHPGMRDLLLWHAAEELEHRSVAFEVYRVAGGGYLLRILGLIAALTILSLFWRSATHHLFAQEPGLDRKRVKERGRTLKAQGRNRSALLSRAIWPYLKVNFHPDKDHDGAPAVAYLQEIGRLAG
ncbi:MAG: metal-dependent hydrolase [Myxococcota bacterium]